MELMSSKKGAEVKQNTTVRCIIWSTIRIWKKGQKLAKWLKGLHLEQSWPCSALLIYTESTPKAETEDSHNSNMQLYMNRRTHTHRGQTGNTFSETGVISQASVGEYCTSDYKNRGRTSTMTLRMYLHSESHCKSVSRSHSAGPAVELTSIVFPSAWSAW